MSIRTGQFHIFGCGEPREGDPHSFPSECSVARKLKLLLATPTFERNAMPTRKSAIVDKRTLQIVVALREAERAAGDLKASARALEVAFREKVLAAQRGRGQMPGLDEVDEWSAAIESNRHALTQILKTMKSLRVTLAARRKNEH